MQAVTRITGTRVTRDTGKRGGKGISMRPGRKKENVHVPDGKLRRALPNWTVVVLRVIHAFLATGDAYYGRGTGMQDRARLISLYKASDTSYQELVRL